MADGMIRVRVKPGSRRGPLVEEDTEADYLVTVRERAVEGKANAAVERALADHLGIAPSRVTIVRGHTARIKSVRIQ